MTLTEPLTDSTMRPPTGPTGVRRLLAGPDSTPLPSLRRSELTELVEQAGLTGRGGAGFPTARKLAALGKHPVVVANAMEGEPLSRKDAVLLAEAPELVIDGLRIAGHALGSRRLVLAVGDQIDTSRAEAAAVGRGVELLKLPGGFVAGQETALVNQINGRPAVPSDRLLPPYVKGVDGRSTLVSNAETLAQLALLARYGADWFRRVGTPTDPGTFLVSVTGSTTEVLAQPGVLEVARGTSLATVLETMRVDTSRVRAVLVGGYHGAWVPASGLDVPLSREGLARFGATPGAGIIHVLDPAHCPLQVSADVASYLAGEVVGQCGPCVNGMPRMADTLQQLAALASHPGGGQGRVGNHLLAQVKRLRVLVDGRGACAHPDGTARFVASTLRTFGADVEAHLAGRCLRGTPPRPHGGAR